jgi:TonB family protein
MKALHLLVIASLLPFPLCAAERTASPAPLVSVAAVTVSIEPGPTPLDLPAERKDGTLRLHPRWSLTLDASGRVSALEIQPDGPIDAVRVPLENAIRSWRFTPGSIGGQPAETRTTLALDVSLVDRGDDTFGVRIDDARTGADLTLRGFHHVVPKYPPAAIRKHGEGIVVLRIDYDAEGHVVATRLHDGAPDVDAPFVRSAEDAARRWTFSPEVVGGRGVPGSTIVPICYADYSRHRPTENSGCTWTPPAGHGGLGDGAIVGIDSVVRLETDVVGRTL